MSESKFTPGPWLQADGDKTFIYALNEKGYNRFWFKLQSNTHKEWEASQEELDANANLISASTELFEACEEFVRKVECGEARSTKSYEQMKKAVAKAKGIE